MRLAFYSDKVGKILQYLKHQESVVANEGLELIWCSRCGKSPIVTNTTGAARNLSESWFSAP